MHENVQTLTDRQRLQTYYKRYRPLYENALRRLTRRLRSRVSQVGPKATVKSRIKTFHSYYQKMLRQAEVPTVGGPQVNDLLGIRIICPFLADVEQVARYLCQHFEVVEEERKGDDRSLREFGYDSIHLLLAVPEDLLPETMPGTLRVCEVQIRTILQEAWAEVEHELIYKTDLTQPDESVQRKLASLNATLTLSDAIFQELRDVQLEQKRSRQQRHRNLHEKVAALEAFEVPLDFDHWDGLLSSYETGPASRRLERVLTDALEAHSNQEYDRAVRLYTKVLKMEPSPQVQSITLNHRGMACFLLSDYETSLEDFSEALLQNPENNRAYYNRSLVLCVMHRFEEALKDLERSIELNRFHVESWYGRARVLSELRRFEEALESATGALELEPTFEPARKLLADLQKRSQP